MNYWDREWANHDITDFRKYINPERDYIFLDYFRTNNVKTVCDIGCGFGISWTDSSYSSLKRTEGAKGK
ncbi:MAG TPA: hypothetical protein GX501_08395 [Clostridiaceae bacterium]|nr:hypothetical protein [Clostridiaceae bacterium]